MNCNYFKYIIERNIYFMEQFVLFKNSQSQSQTNFKK